MGGRGLPPERARVVLGLLAAGLNPNQAARAAGVGKTFAYELDRKVTGVPSRPARPEAVKRGRRGLLRERVQEVLSHLASGLNPGRQRLRLACLRACLRT